MNANEFRIGNWYSQFGNLHQVTWDTIKALGDAPETQLWCKPIPLSPEILEKCGFENQRYEEWEAFAYKDTAICASWDGVEWVFKYGYDSDLSIASCEFLHQLQNLIYALTGEELTYKQ